MMDAARPLIGMLRTEGAPGRVSQAMALAAQAQGADLIFFLADDIVPERRIINAKTFNGQTWDNLESRYPDVIENNDEALSIRHWVKWEALRKTARFTTRRLGGKAEVSRRIATAPEFAPYIIPQMVARADADIDGWLESHGEIILKPVFGSKGENVWKLWRGDRGISVSTNGATEIVPDSRGLLAHIAGDRPFLLQRYVHSQTDAGNPFDIRLHVRRDGRGRWTTVKIYARIGPSGRIISNLAAGGSISEATALLNIRYPTEGATIFKNLQKMALTIPDWMQRLYPEFTIDALGIDVGLDETGAPWLFEINSSPGARYFEVADAIPRVAYCLYLARNRAKPKALAANTQKPRPAD